MAWEDDMPEILRVMVNDLEDTPTYSDEKLLRVLVVAAFQVLRELTFAQTYTVNIQNQTISPDPTASATLEESFVNLVTIKAACILDRGSAVTAASRAISVRDGGSAVDLRGVFGANLKLLEKGWCAVYEQEKLAYQAGQTRVAGAAVMTPFRVYASWSGEGRSINFI